MVNNILINEKTIAVVKENNETIIYDDKEKIYINHHIKRVLEYNCTYYGSTLNGRKESAQKILNVKYRVPIVIEGSKDLVLIQTGNFRDKECIFIMANKIISYEEVGDKLKVNCINNISFLINISKYSFEKLLINSFRLTNILKYRKFNKIV